MGHSLLNLNPKLLQKVHVSWQILTFSDARKWGLYLKSSLLQKVHGVVCDDQEERNSFWVPNLETIPDYLSQSFKPTRQAIEWQEERNWNTWGLHKANAKRILAFGFRSKRLFAFKKIFNGVFFQKITKVNLIYMQVFHESEFVS